MDPYFWFLFILFFIFGYNIILILVFFCNGGPWSLDKPSSLISVVLLGSLFSCIGKTTVCVFWQMSA